MIFLGLVLGTTAPKISGLPAPAVIKTLIITGQNNHNWKISSPILEQILNDAALFEADIVESPPRGGEYDGFFRRFFTLSTGGPGL